MNKETMTIHKGLAELKVLDARIEKEINATTFSVANKHSNTVVNGVPIAEFANQAKDALKSIKTLIARRNDIKRKITRSNASTTVTIGGKEYTVAEAIDMKNVGMEHMKYLCSLIENQYTNAKMKAERENGEKLEQRADTYIQSLYQNADKKNLSEEVKKMRDDFMTSQTVEILDPIGSLKEVAALRNEIDAFMAEVDSALSVSNALTTIEIEYETY